jgi:small subunit ribosomal protein S8
MSINDPLANVLSHILNCDKLGKEYCLITPKSKIIMQILVMLREQGMIGDYEQIEERHGGVIKVKLIGRINKCGVIKPRYSFTKIELQKYEKRYLPGEDFGFLIVTTSKGLMTNKQAIEKKEGGKLLAYCY